MTGFTSWRRKLEHRPQRDNFSSAASYSSRSRRRARRDEFKGRLSGRTLDFWRGLDGLGDASTYELPGVFTCGKAEPMQLAPSRTARPSRAFAAFGF